MIIRIKELETGATRDYNDKQVKGGKKYLPEMVKNFNELKKREDAKDWAMMLEVVGFDYDIDWLEVTDYEVELIGA